MGGPTNHLLSDRDLGTGIGLPTTGTCDMSMLRALQRTAARASDPDCSLKEAYAHINKLCSVLGLQRDARHTSMQDLQGGSIAASKGFQGQEQSSHVCSSGLCSMQVSLFLVASSV